MTFGDIIFIGLLSTLVTSLLFLLLTYRGEEEDLTKCTKEELNNEF